MRTRSPWGEDGDKKEKKLLGFRGNNGGTPGEKVGWKKPIASSVGGKERVWCNQKTGKEGEVSPEIKERQKKTNTGRTRRPRQVYGQKKNQSKKTKEKFNKENYNAEEEQ